MTGPELDAAVKDRQERCRLAVGRIEPKLARRCGWCRRWMSDADRKRADAGAQVTDGICPPCRADHFPNLPPAA